MADLDDFFAKKDRKKAKGKKFTTTEEIAKKLEETGKKVEKHKLKEKPSNAEGGEDNQRIEVSNRPRAQPLRPGARENFLLDWAPREKYAAAMFARV